jgi:hypothetical protein
MQHVRLRPLAALQYGKYLRQPASGEAVLQSPQLGCKAHVTAFSGPRQLLCRAERCGGQAATTGTRPAGMCDLRVWSRRMVLPCLLPARLSCTVCLSQPLEWPVF